MTRAGRLRRLAGWLAKSMIETRGLAWPWFLLLSLAWLDLVGDVDHARLRGVLAALLLFRVCFWLRKARA